MITRRNFSKLKLSAAMLALTVSGLTSCRQASEQAVIETQTQTYYLLRHAEKQKGDDPGLTEVGHARAALLKDMLEDKGITHIHSSQYRRTLQTAAPLARSTGLEVMIYDPRDLPAMAAKLKSMPGVHLVVGHSNTTPQLAALMTGDPVEPMPETEYDRITQVNLNPDGTLKSWSITRFGNK